MALFSFFPYTRKGRGRRSFAPLYFFPLSFFLPTSLSSDPWPTTRQKNRANKPFGRLPRGHPTTLPLCHDWIGVIGLSPYFFPINTGRRDEPKKGGEYREKEDRED